MSAPVDIRGKQFGELTAIEPTDQIVRTSVVWNSPHHDIMKAEV